ncbi:MAG TPA: FtsQ-type POTRA domain-containing protein [Victivallales bacterium]|nr:FtsQ-type POTRA domain-containing protein [Victivallales bacterium]HRU00936.1 FtsQ-type POTRA domain-containing protein [Victivallales bacterium]
MLSENPHFIIRKILIKGSVLLKARESQVFQYGMIKPNQTNLFALNLKELRKKISSLPIVESATISRKLPDTVIITISERIPRVGFNYHGRRWYADENGVVFSAASYGQIRRDLPLVVGFSAPDVITEGEYVEKLIFPAKLSAIANRYYPEFIIQRIDLSYKTHIVLKLHPLDSYDYYTVIFPKEKAFEKFALFKWAYLKSLAENTGKRIFDLRFEGQVVTR